MTEERELQFHTALLSCGSVSNLSDALRIEAIQGPRQSDSRINYRNFKVHKQALLEHLCAADYFDVYYEPYALVTRNASTLTEKAAMWISEFYLWLMEQQESYKPL